MKLNSIFKLYKSCYPSVSVQRVTLSATGGMLRMTDVRRSFRLSLFSLQSLGDMSRRESLERNAATREFMDDNRREMFMLGETRCLYGIVYAENLGCDLRLMSMITQNSELPRTGSVTMRAKKSSPFALSARSIDSVSAGWCLWKNDMCVSSIWARTNLRKSRPTI